MSRRWSSSKRKTRDKEFINTERPLRRKLSFRSKCRKSKTNKELQSTTLTAPTWRTTRSVSGKLKSRWTFYSLRHLSTLNQEERTIWMRTLPFASTTSTSPFRSCILRRTYILLAQIGTIATSRPGKLWSRLEEDTRDLMSTSQDSIVNSRRSSSATWSLITRVLSGSAMSWSRARTCKFLQPLVQAQEEEDHPQQEAQIDSRSDQARWNNI